MPRPIRIGEVTAAFDQGYAKKSPQNQGAVDKALRLLVADLHYPSLRAKKMAGHKDVWEVRANPTVRMTFHFTDEDTVALRVCCTHDIYRNP